jgi:hypothetical protein
MRTPSFVAIALLLAPTWLSAEPGGHALTRDFDGTSARRELCAFLLDSKRSADFQGRLDFSAAVISSEEGDSPMFTAHVFLGPPTAIGRINFVGNSNVGDAVLRRALVIYERDVLDINRLRDSLTRLNSLGLFERIQSSDVEISRRDDGITADLTIRLRPAKRWRWALSTNLLGVPGVRATLSLRLPNWGGGLVDASTYLVSLNLFGISRPLLLLERPLLAGQALFSGFAVGPKLTPPQLLLGSGQTQLGNAIGPLLEPDRVDSLSVPIVSFAGLATEPLVCKPPRALRWWAQRGASILVSLALGNS